MTDDNSNRKWKLATIALTTLLIGTIGYSIYAIVDQGVTISYKEQVIHELKTKENMLLGLMFKTHIGQNKDNVIKTIYFVDPNVEPFEKEGNIYASYLEFRFDNSGLLISIKPE